MDATGHSDPENQNRRYWNSDQHRLRSRQNPHLQYANSRRPSGRGNGDPYFRKTIQHLGGPMSEYVSINRDPFSRFDTIRQTIPKDERKSCAWCGRPGRFRYGSLNDGPNRATSFRAGNLLLDRLPSSLSYLKRRLLWHNPYARQVFVDPYNNEIEYPNSGTIRIVNRKDLPPAKPQYHSDRHRSTPSAGQSLHHRPGR